MDLQLWNELGLLRDVLLVLLCMVVYAIIVWWTNRDV